VLIVTAFVGSTPLPILGWAAAFLFFAAASDLRYHRVPDLLPLPALCGAVLISRNKKSVRTVIAV
jgi:prepilin signal peptidase PulO-like enzyme (type II secretory pathway)